MSSLRRIGLDLMAAFILGLVFFNISTATPITSALSAPSYTVTDLHVGANSRATGVSENGKVVGTWDSGGFLATTQSFFWTPGAPNGATGTMQDLGNFGFQAFVAAGVNNSGQVAASGQTQDQFGNPLGAPFIWQGGTLTRLLTPIIPGGCFPFTGCTNPSFMNGGANAINQQGQVAGTFGFQGSRAAFWPVPFSPFPSGVAVEISTPHSVALGANDLAHVTGNSNAFGTTPFGNAFLWMGAGAPQSLGTLPGADYSVGRGMNNSDQVVGDSGATNHTQRAFVWDNGSMQDLGAGIAYDINNRGQVVGAQNGHAFIWEKGLGIIDLNTLLPADSGWTLTQALAINDVGQIVGEGIFNDAQNAGISLSAVFPRAAFLLTPSVLPSAVPEPGTLALFCAGFVGLGAMGWRIGAFMHRRNTLSARCNAKIVFNFSGA